MTAWKTLCVECGPNIGIDEDGCCMLCGNVAVGSWLYRNQEASLTAAELEAVSMIRGALMYDYPPGPMQRRMIDVLEKLLAQSESP